MVRLLRYKTALGRHVDVKCYADNWKFKRVKLHGEGPRYRYKLMRELSFDAIEMILDDIRAAQQNGMDKVIMLTGEEGTGKSTLAAHIATRLGVTSPEEVCFSGTDLWKKLKEVEDCKTIWYDEGARGMYRRDWMEKFQRQLTKAFTQIRIKKLACIICLPHRGLLDSLMERRIGYWGHVVSRGYHRGFVEWAVPDTNRWYIAVNWIGWFTMRFPKFRENNGFSWDEYEVLKRQALEDFFDEEEVKYTRLVPFLCHTVHSLKEKMNMTVREMHELMGMSEANVRRYLHMKDPLAEERTA